MFLRQIRMWVVATLAIELAVCSYAAAPKLPPPPKIQCIYGCPHPMAEHQAPDISGSSPVTLLHLLRWIASLHDLSDYNKLLTGLRQPGDVDQFYQDIDGQRQLDWTRYLHRVPLAAGSPFTVDYSVDDPRGAAAKLQGSSHGVRGRITFSIDSGRVCIKKAWMDRYFKSPFLSGVLPDGGYISWQWDIGVWKQRHVYAYGIFGNNSDQCVNNIDLMQTNGPDPRLF